MEKLGSVSEAARISVCSREAIYKNRKLLKEKGPWASKHAFRTDIHHKKRAAKTIEGGVIAFSVENPHIGQVLVSAQLKTTCQVELSPAGVRCVWLSEKMNPSAMRVQRAKSSLAVA